MNTNASIQKKRIKCTLLHLSFSGILAFALLYLIYNHWYPSPLAEASGVTRIVQITLTSLIITPILTYFIYKENRAKLHFDLSAIMIIQLLIYASGLYISEQGRPAWLVFVVDTFETVRVVDINKSKESQLKPQYTTNILSTPRWVAAVYSTAPDIQRQQKEEEIFSGISLAQRPESYAPLTQRALEILKRARPISQLTQFNTPDQVKKATSKTPDATSWLPLKAPEKDMVVLLDNKAHVLAIVDLRPWN